VESNTASLDANLVKTLNLFPAPPFTPPSAARASSNASPPSRFTGLCSFPGTLPIPIPIRSRSGHIVARRSKINSGNRSHDHAIV
jgi:hypothetical protein